MIHIIFLPSKQIICFGFVILGHVQLLLQCTPSAIALATAITTLVKVHKGKHGAESLMLFLALEVRVTIESNTCRHD